MMLPAMLLLLACLPSLSLFLFKSAEREFVRYGRACRDECMLSFSMHELAHHNLVVLLAISISKSFGH